jgi:GTP-binding protein
VHVLLTKADKLGRQQQVKQQNEARRQLANILAHASVQLFSSVTGDGVEEARKTLLQWLAPAR